MRKLYRYIKLHIKIASHNVIRNLGLTLSASFAITITLMLISIFLLITSNLTSFTYDIEKQVMIRASIDKIVKSDEREKLQQQIRAIPGVKTLTFSTGKEELESYKSEYKNEKNLFSMYEGKASPIQDTFHVEVQQHIEIKHINDTIAKLKGITSSQYGGEATDEMMNGLQGIRNGGFIFIIFLIFIAIFLIANKIKFSIATRTYEIAIMRFVGASNWCIKCPMMVEGMIIGILGSIVPIIVTIVAYQILYKATNGSLFTNMLHLQKSFPLTIHIAIMLLSIGIFVGLFGSFFATSKYIKWKR